MSFQFRCPICNSERKATENIIGRRVRCADCNNFVEIPPPPDPQSGDEGQSGGTTQLDTESENYVEPEPEPAGEDGVFNLGAPTEKLASEADLSSMMDMSGSKSAVMDAGQGSGSTSGDIEKSQRSRKDVIVRWKEEPDDDETSAKVSFSGDREREESEMDMTPMVDVTFLLLIFFMVTASFSMQKTIEQPPQRDDQPSTNVTLEDFEDDPDFVTVLVDEFNTFRVITNEWDEEAPSEQELIIKLRRAREGDSQGNVPSKLLVTAHGDAHHGKVVTAMDAGTDVGIEQIQVVMTEDEFD